MGITGREVGRLPLVIIQELRYFLGPLAPLIVPVLVVILTARAPRLLIFQEIFEGRAVEYLRDGPPAGILGQDPLLFRGRLAPLPLNLPEQAKGGDVGAQLGDGARGCERIAVLDYVVSGSSAIALSSRLALSSAISCSIFSLNSLSFSWSFFGRGRGSSSAVSGGATTS